MLRVFAKIVSVIFHPLLILTYMLILLLLVNPYLFGVNDIAYQSRLILLMFMSTFLLPAFAVFMMRNLGLVSSIELENKQERIGPYIITGVFYLWMYMNFKNNPTIPAPYTIFVLGATIGLFMAFFLNIFTKISAHAVGMGGFIGMTVITTWLFSYGTFTVNAPMLGALEVSMNSLLMIVIVLAGLVGSARLILDAHTNDELYGGYLVGIFSQFVALFFSMP